MKKGVPLWPVWLVVGLFCVYLTAVVWHLGFPAGENAVSGGEFGDAFGVLTSLFNGLAFAGLLIALKLQRDDLAMQRQELQLQRQELEQTREVMQEQEAQMRASAEAAQRQLFESTFFSLLASFRGLVDGMKYGDAAGRAALLLYVGRLFRYDKGILPKKEAIKEIADIYIGWLRANDHVIRPYVDMLLAVFDFIEGSDRPNKEFYFGLARSYLSRPEKTLMFYHGIAVAADERLKMYIERYSLFREVDRRVLHQSERDIHSFYEDSAYSPITEGQATEA